MGKLKSFFADGGSLIHRVRAMNDATSFFAEEFFSFLSGGSSHYNA